MITPSTSTIRALIGLLTLKLEIAMSSSQICFKVRGLALQIFGETSELALCTFEN
jgi:hypothetical protein